VKTWTMVIAVAAALCAVGALLVLPDPKSVLVASICALVVAACVFLRRVSAEPAVGTSDAPAVDPFKDYTGGGPL
jgi:hypothetical protein